MPTSTARSDIFVSPDWLAERLDAPDIVVVDGSYYLSTMNRDAEAEYQAGHIPGAVRFDIDTVKDKASPLPHMMPTAAEFARAVGALGIGDGMSIVIYDGMGLFSAPRVRWMFKAFGARNVHILDGGFPAWVAAGLPVEDGAPRPRQPRSFTARFDAGAVADRNDVARALASGQMQVVDARPADRFQGDAPEPRAGLRSGHMPGSSNLPFAKLIENGRLKDKDALNATFAEAGIDPAAPLIATCGSGVSAAILSTALELVGHPGRAVYDGSWAEWGGDDTCPLATGPAKPSYKG
jgi:thiosulfate/3-mercaptopyruvate sulfurtransferase